MREAVPPYKNPFNAAFSMETFLVSSAALALVSFNCTYKQLLSTYSQTIVLSREQVAVLDFHTFVFVVPDFTINRLRSF